MLPWLFGCSDEDPERTPPAVDWADVAPIISARCMSCHGPGGVAGLPFGTWQEAHDARDVMLFALEDGQMPPWPAGPSAFPFQDNPTLSDDELELIRSWVGLDAPLGKGSKEPLPTSALPVLPRVDATLTAAAPYLPKGEGDDYRCFAVSAEPSSPAEGYIRGLQFVIGNPSTVHHARLERVFPLGGMAAIEALEAADPDRGWNCNGELGNEIRGGSERLATWLPGNGPTLLPEGTGIPIEPGAIFLMTLHFYLPSFDGQPDDTRIELLLEPTVERAVEELRVSDLAWKEGAFLIPAGEPNAEFFYELTLDENSFDQLDPAQGVEALSVQLHMHNRGQRGLVTFDRGLGLEALLDIPRWDFDWQLDYWLVEPEVLHTGDRVAVTCSFDNSEGTRAVVWGEGYTDEMCGAVLYATQAENP